MGIAGSFYALFVTLILRLLAGLWKSKFSWLTKVIPYLNYASIGLAALFTLFVVIAIITAVIRNRNNR